MRAADGEAVPALEAEPVLPAYWRPVWDGFLTLNRCRPVGFGVGAIPLAEIKCYLEMFTYPDVEEFVRCVKEMDAAYLEFVDKKEQSRGK